MAVTVPVHMGYELEVRADAAEVFALLSDVPASVAFFPKVHQLTDLGDRVYQWEMDKVGTPQVNIQTVYASRYSASKARGTVTWKPVPGIGNALVGGGWKISDRGKSTHIELRIDGEITVPLPALMKVVVAPLVQSEFEKLVEKYLANLARRLGGEI